MNISCKNFYYNKETHNIVENILAGLASNKKELEGYIQWDHNVKKIIHWKYNVCRLKNNSTHTWDLHAYAGLNESAEQSIELYIFIRKGTWTKNHQVSIPELIGVIAHELHHLVQDWKNKKVINSRKQDMLDYLLDPREKEAFHVGFRAQSIISKKSIVDCMDDYLNCKVKSGNITKDQKDTVINEWLTVDWSLVDIKNKDGINVLG